MSTPEVRLSPDGSVAIRWRGSEYWESRHAPGCYPVALVDADVSNWRPLLPAAIEDRAIEPHLTMLRMVAERLDSSAAISARPGQMEDLETAAGAIRETVLKLRHAWAVSNQDGAEPEQLPPVLDRAAGELHRGH